ncbi:MAG: hypothetical protein HC811_13855, partial [Flammeovirgaceae bacterium]|nr:hypothetical protein [Flammeovirgaceae bacterium]
IEDADDGASGYRINGLYEFNPGGGKVAHGFSVGYIGVGQEGSYSYTIGGSTTTITAESNSNTWPIYYAPKFMFGDGKFKGFIKGALGMQFSGLNVKSSGSTILEDNDAGFYGGASLGGMISVKENMFLNLEYEWAYLSNSFYKDGFMNSVMLGIGFKF